MRRILLSLAITMVVAAPVAAQRSGSQQRTSGSDGLWFSAGLGGGWARVACDICQTDRGTDISGALAVGGRLNRRLLVGAEASAWLHGDGTVDESLLGITAVANWHPESGQGFLWKAGVGLLTYRAEDQQDAFSTTAIGFQLGTGYVLPVRGRFAATTYMTVFLAPLGGEVKFNSATIIEKASLSLLQFGIGVVRR